MIYGSVCSGIEAATVAWHPLGWQPAFFSEIEKFPRAVLAHHYPDTPLHGDFTTIEENTYEPIDLLVGGTPCQSFSVAGLRGGMDDERGNLALQYLKLASRTCPQWLVWENVPGVLSSSGGRDFGAFLGGLVELGYGFAYRVLDAQFFGVPQRRRRVFVVGCLGDWRAAAAVLFERHSLQGHSAPRREAGQTAPTIPSRSTGGGGLGTDFDRDGGLRAVATLDASYARLQGCSGQDANHGHSHLIAFQANATADQAAAAGHNVSPTMVNTAPAVAIRTANTSSNGHGFTDELSYTLDQTNGQAVAFAQNSRDEVRYQGGDGQVCGALAVEPGMKQTTYVAQPVDMSVRRLTPTECERLQGFPDSYTQIPWRNKDSELCPDGPRYKALGNSMAVPVMRWIGERIDQVDSIRKTA